MGHFAMTCSISGLGISEGTPVRCLLLTISPYVGEDPRQPWIVRTPPIRAEYNGYGSIENIHPDDEKIARLWVRGLREDVVEKGLGDNAYHDVPVSRDMSFEELLKAIQAGRLEVRRDVKNFWMRPLDDEDRVLSMLRQIEGALKTRFSGRVSRHMAKDKYVVDEPVPGMVRVRYGEYQHGQVHIAALNEARVYLENMECAQDRCVCAVTAGSGRYGDAADLLVFPAPSAKGAPVRGPQWDMSAGQAADEHKTLHVGLAMIREDVWQKLIAYPHVEYVSLPCVHCGQSPAYHKDGACPADKAPPKGALYQHAAVFPDGVPHFFQQGSSKYVWYGLDAFKEVTRSTWAAVQARLRHRNVELVDISGKDPGPKDALVEALECEEARARWEAEALRKRENPFFGDYRIRDLDVGDCRRPGAWVFCDSTPGIIGISEHLSMLVADKTEASSFLLDALAELSAVRRVLNGVGVVLKPATSTGPQNPEWRESTRFLGTMLGLAERMVAARADEELEGEASFATYAEAAAALSGAKAHMKSTLKKASRKRKT